MVVLGRQSQKINTNTTTGLPTEPARLCAHGGGGWQWICGGRLGGGRGAVGGGCGLAVLAALQVTRSYVAYSLAGDLRDITAHYMTVSGTSFFVAVNQDDGGRVVGCVAVDRPHVAGFAGGQFVASDTTDRELRRMSVAAGLRGQGVGRRLLHTALDFTRAVGYNNLILSTSQAQESFVCRQSFGLGESGLTKGCGLLAFRRRPGCCMRRTALHVSM